VVSWSGPEGASGQAGYDRLALTAGSVNRLLPIPGVAAYAYGFHSIAEAIYLRDHITRQLELAEVATDPHERAARWTFVVGAGDTGTEVTAHGCAPATRGRRAAIRRLMRGGAEDRGPKHRANSWTRRAASRRWLRGILACELRRLIPLRGGVLPGWCQYPWPGILAAR
jgi:hypothetical protein